MADNIVIAVTPLCTYFEINIYFISISDIKDSRSDKIKKKPSKNSPFILNIFNFRFIPLTDDCLDCRSSNVPNISTCRLIIYFLILGKIMKYFGTEANHQMAPGHFL